MKRATPKSTKKNSQSAAGQAKSRKPAARRSQKRRSTQKTSAGAQEWFGLHKLKCPSGSHKPKKMRGRGPGSGHGKTSCRGSKGQTSRTGHTYYAGFEGGHTPMIRRMPKRGFINEFKKEYQIVNIKDLSRVKDSTITPEVLETAGLVKDKSKLIKILGKGEIKKAYVIKAHAFSQKAAAAIAEAGGKTETIPIT